MDHKHHLVPTLLPWVGAPSSRPDCSKPHLAWPGNTSMDGESMTSLRNLCQCLTTFRVKNFFLISRLKLASFSLNPSPFFLSLPVLVNTSEYVQMGREDLIFPPQYKCTIHTASLRTDKLQKKGYLTSCPSWPSWPLCSPRDVPWEQEACSHFIPKHPP